MAKRRCVGFGGTVRCLMTETDRITSMDWRHEVALGITRAQHRVPISLPESKPNGRA
jgi:hypothetical protein